MGEDGININLKASETLCCSHHMDIAEGGFNPY